MTAICDAEGGLVGVFTDGDVRRVLDRGLFDPLAPVSSAMNPHPRTIAPERPAAEALQTLEHDKINGLLVVAQGKLVGALNMHDLLRAGVV